MADDKSPDSDLEYNPRGSYVSKEVFEDFVKSVDHCVAISLKEDKYLISYLGEDSLTLTQSLQMWGYFTEWLLKRAHLIEEDHEEGEDCGKYVIQAFARKVQEMGEAEWKRRAERDES